LSPRLTERLEIREERGRPGMTPRRPTGDRWSFDDPFHAEETIAVDRLGERKSKPGTTVWKSKGT
jgi:hypothetical protein